ncbi:sugar transferase [Acidipropionibacterium jensenii]|uniref:sugar transferase n=1 Tax=Acidipropionibacterium jensenii TaxID=1749 RepID=UPI00056D36E4|nr:sugar transferase [Acidipropionibacterium jensenii]MDN5978097.1 sugar transferase [Acidipropionibacterium jensenii]MDN5996885.1 sugar transferase [Acidipropionibacterium jensenii]MDN6427267.1 sugar transferase [Acidipropionibacterium jensenii]MDN6442127.1 sugar transferase [Acidipropionibacterium jensenii]MDN6480854.1 sugar transferase [Acidipropionibacterium jensenii]
MRRTRVPQKVDFNKTQKLLTAVIDVAVFVGCLYLSFYLRFFTSLGFIPSRNLNDAKAAMLVSAIGFLAINVLSGVYVLYNKTVLDVWIITVVDQILITVFIMALTFAGRWFAFPRSVLLINLAVSIIVLVLWRTSVFLAYQRIRGVKRVMVLGPPDQISGAVLNYMSNRSRRHRLTQVVDGHYLEQIRAHIDEFDTAHVSDLIPNAERTAIYDLLLGEEKEIFLTTSFEHLLLVNPTIMSIEDESIIAASPFKIPSEFDLIKRCFDFLVALIGLIIASPVMLVTAILVRTTSPGPVFYRQTRITKGGKEFRILKFRSMGVTAEKNSGPMLATTNDPRVTPVGKYLRSLRIDELPQLFNVLVGDMSMVGPRPERPFFVDQFQQGNAHYRLRHNVRAGLTGYAQVYGKYASDFASKLNFDLIYIKEYSLLLDVKIMIQTIKILFDKVSSRGVDETEERDTTVRLPEGVQELH